MLLDREEYVEQTYFFRTLRERMRKDVSTQELLAAIKYETLSTTNLPLALDYLASELRLTGGFATAMSRLDHYFTPFQTFVIAEAEKEGGRFDFRIALKILESEADYRTRTPSKQGIFLYQFEAVCRNRLGYDDGLNAIGHDPIFSEQWRNWINTVRRQIGLVDFADMIYVRSELYKTRNQESEAAVLFGEKEGRIALANRRKDPLYLFSALARQLGYPAVPKPTSESSNENMLPLLQRRVERLESRLKLCEEEMRGGINIEKFYESPDNDKK